MKFAEPLPIFRRHILLRGRFTSVSRRRLRRAISAVGGRIVRREGRTRAPDFIVQGNADNPRASAPRLDGTAPAITESQMTEMLGFHLGFNQRLSRLRNVVAQAPALEVWIAIATELELWPLEQNRAVAVAYVAHHCTDWPDGIRIALPSWLRRAKSGEAEPRLRVCRAADLSNRHAGPRLVNHFQSWNDDWLRLDGMASGFTTVPLDGGQATTLLRHPDVVNIANWNFNGRRISRVNFTDAAPLEIARLGLASTEITGDHLGQLQGWGALRGALLDLRHNGFEPAQTRQTLGEAQVGQVLI